MELIATLPSGREVKLTVGAEPEMGDVISVEGTDYAIVGMGYNSPGWNLERVFLV